MRFIIRTLAAGAISMAAKILIKKIQDSKRHEDGTNEIASANPIATPAK
ncbi:hypothetical protein [Parasphingorhabdus halotolerans]|uniref:Uncharacterized protein n=1 Tax=Parasphingorhabdus halotolerans TaxID=2725558 RepID=A0A6H2DQ66_9SPHN|nr:hypothetical protein [Parasphingorhabdus halotolerans]QJB70277.1 hypothetical protein HF685_14165 [Parasphingorhabdus halotolerans]